MNSGHILVIGSTGRTGRLVVDAASARGHRVTAFTRRPAMLTLDHPTLTVVGGDGVSRADVAAAVRGHDAVIAIVATDNLRRTTLAQDVAGNVVDAMRRHGVARLVMTSSHALVAHRPRLGSTLVRLLLRHPFADARAMEQIVTTSDLDWRIIRASRLTDEPARGAVVRADDGEDFVADAADGLPRADLAEEILNVLEDDQLSRTAIEVTGVLSERSQRKAGHSE